MADWQKYITVADEFLVMYFAPPLMWPTAKMFLIGHTVELYLKAAHLKKTNDVEATLGYMHNVWGLFLKMKKLDPGFMPDFNVNEKVFQTIKDGKSIESFTTKEMEHYHEYGEFYSICRFQGDLKYLGLHSKKRSGIFAMGGTIPNPFWTKFIISLRKYLGFPTENYDDILTLALSDPDIPEQYRAPFQSIIDKELI